MKPRQKPKITDDRVPPRFTRDLGHLNAPEGRPVELSAEFTAVPPVREVFWYKDGLQMESSVDFHIQSTSTRSVLRIRQAYKSDSSFYQVKVFNVAGVAVSQAYLSVVPGLKSILYNFFS